MTILKGSDCLRCNHAGGSVQLGRWSNVHRAVTGGTICVGIQQEQEGNMAKTKIGCRTDYVWGPVTV